MGAISFITDASGPDAESAFDQAVALAKSANAEDRDPQDDEDILDEDAWCSNIGDKIGFTMIETPADLDASDRQAVERAVTVLLDDPRVSDAFGNAGCIDLGPVPGAFAPHRAYVFFGWSPE